MDRKLKIAVLFGGCSPEYGVSLQSAAAVLRHMDRERYKPVMVGISRSGDWFHYTDTAHFSRVFKKSEGMSAGEWRNLHCGR